MISVTVTDRSGRTLSGQTIDAFWVSIAHARPFSVGVNCALGAAEMRPYLETLARVAPGHRWVVVLTLGLVAVGGAMSAATWWISRASPVSITSPHCVRVPSRMR